MRAGKTVVWVIEGKASQPLREMLAGTSRPVGPKIELLEGAGAYDEVVKKYGLKTKAKK